MGHCVVQRYFSEKNKNKRTTFLGLSLGSSKLIRTTSHSIVQHAARRGLSYDVRCPVSPRDISISHLLFTHQSLITQNQLPVQKRKAQNYLGSWLQPPPLPSLFTAPLHPFFSRKDKTEEAVAPCSFSFQGLPCQKSCHCPQVQDDLSDSVEEVVKWLHHRRSGTQNKGRRCFALKAALGIDQGAQLRGTYLPARFAFPQFKLGNKRFGGERVDKDKAGGKIKLTKTKSRVLKNRSNRPVVSSKMVLTQRVSWSRSGQVHRVLTAPGKSRGKETIASHLGERSSGPPRVKMKSKSMFQQRFHRKCLIKCVISQLNHLNHSGP